MRSPSKILVLTIVLQLVLPLSAFFQGAAVVYAQELPEEDPSFKERKVKEGFTLDLKELIERSKKKIEQVDDKLKDQAQERRNQQREAKAREYFEKAQSLYDQGEFDKARELWEKAIKITEHDEMSDYIGQSVRRQRKQEKALEKAEQRRLKRMEKDRGYSAKEVNKKYREGVKFYKDKKYLAAKVAFEEVDEMFPDHKATRSYIALIDDKIESEQKKRIEEKLSNKTFSTAKAKARWKKELQEQEEQRQKELRDRAEALYKEAVRLYKDKQFKTAKEKFKELEWILPDYKKTIKYLSHIDEDIKKNGVTFSEEDKVKFFRKEYKRMREQEDWAAKNQVDTKKVREFTEDRRRREEAAFVYDAALTLYKKDYYRQALEKFYEVQALYPDFKKTQRYIRKLHKKVPGSENQFTRMKKEAGDKAGQLYRPAAGVNEQVVRAMNEEDRKKLELAESKYQQAVGFYNERNFTEAQRKFIAVESVVPGYKATRDYLKNIDGDIAKEEVQSAKKKEQRKHKAKDSKSREVKDTSYREKYRQAKAEFKTGNYEQAKAVFQEVNRLRPGYRGTERYLERIDKKMAQNTTVVAKGGLRETAKDTSPETDSAKRYIAKKVEPIPGMNSGVPKNYPDKLPEPMAVVEAPLTEKEVALNDKQASRSEKTPVTELSEKDLKALERNRKILERMRENPEASARLTERDRKILEQNRREIEKQLTQQEKNSKRHLNDVIGETYKEAQDLFKLEQYAAAKAKFTTVEGIKPGYKRAAEYIRQSDEKLIELYREDVPTDSKESVGSGTAPQRTTPKPAAQSISTKLSDPVGKKEIPRKKTVEELAAEIDDDYYHPMSDIEYSRRMLDTAAQQEALTQQARTERLERLAGAEQKKSEVLESIAELSQEDLKIKYGLGKKLYKAKNYAKAKTVFAQIMNTDPEYKGTQKYIRKIDVILDRQQAKREEFRHKMAMEIPGQQVAATTETSTVSPAVTDEEMIKKQTQEYFKKAESRLDRSDMPGVPMAGWDNKEPQEYPQYMHQMFKDLYNDGRKFYNQKNYFEARTLFLRVEQLRPDYKSTRRYLKKIDKALKVSVAADAENQQELSQSSPLIPASMAKRDQQAIKEYKSELDKEKEFEAARNKFAKIDRLQRLEEQKISQLQSKTAYRESLEAQIADQRKLRKEQQRARRLKEKRAKEAEKRRDREEKLAQKELRDKIRKELMEVRDQALDLLANSEDAKAEVRINKFEELLTHGDFTNRERKRIRKDFRKQQLKIEKTLQKARLKEEKTILAKSQLTSTDRDKLSIKQQRELEQLNERIHEEERKLEEARNKEEERIQKLAQETILANIKPRRASEKAPEVRTQAIQQALDNVNMARVETKDIKTLAELEQQKKKEIEELVQGRQKEIKKKRERVRREFEKNLVQLYKKAIRFYKKGIYDQSADIFREIQRMRPGYKKTEKYLSKIDEARFEQRAAQVRTRQQFQTPALATSGAQVVRPTTPQPPKAKPDRLKSIRNALDDFEEKMW